MNDRKGGSTKWRSWVLWCLRGFSCRRRRLHNNKQINHAMTILWDANATATGISKGVMVSVKPNIIRANKRELTKPVMANSIRLLLANSA